RGSQAFAATLRAADEITVARRLVIEAADEQLRHIVRLLDLRITEVADGLVVQRPLRIDGVVAGVTAIGGETARQVAGRWGRGSRARAGTTRTTERPAGSRGRTSRCAAGRTGLCTGRTCGCAAWRTSLRATG